ncbi:glycosyltransferase family 39 protein [Candidatus Daviesbacteria bacterium]|nr:glycosyltransferase family 39 protein [Candidatus Daviesbacteria bacterium]
MTKQVKIFFLLIILISAILRFYKLDVIPPSLSWDEVANGYNAYTIANWGKDEWGKVFPLTFKSFEDDKHPVHIYFTALSVKLLGLSDFSTRFPAALYGVLNVVVIFYLAKTLFASNLMGLLSALFLAISPYNLQFSRFNHEANFALFFFLLGFLLFLKGIRENRIFLPWGFFSFGVSLLSYHPSKVVVPPLILLLIIFFFKDLLKIKKYFLMALLALSIIFMLMFSDKALLGGARIKQTSINRDKIIKTSFFKKTHNELLGRMEVTFKQYLWHFDPGYLFVTGSSNSKFSIQTVGQFYKSDALFLTIGLIGLIAGILFVPSLRKKLLILLVWAILSPLPSSLVEEAPHAARASFMMGSWLLISAYGFYLLIILLRGKLARATILVLGLAVTFWLFKDYLIDFYTTYPREHGIDWQYGMKQIVEYVKEHNGYSRVYVTDIRFQPYIFFLYYLKTPLPKYLETVIFTQDTEHRKYSLVSSFGKYHFGDWDPIESELTMGVLYAVTPSQYDGLRHRDAFDVKKIIYYPNGTTAFYLVSSI